MTKRTKAVVLALTTVTAATAMTGCALSDKLSQPYQDGPRSGVKNTQPADVVEMPDGFSNLTTKCDHGNRVYVGFHGDHAYAAITVVAQDPTCK